MIWDIPLEENVGSRKFVFKIWMLLEYIVGWLKIDKKGERNCYGRQGECNCRIKSLRKWEHLESVSQAGLSIVRVITDMVMSLSPF